VENGEIVNDATVDVLAPNSVSHAEAGAIMVAPSDAVDGRMGHSRRAKKSGFHQNRHRRTTAASCFYGPFRMHCYCARFGDIKKTYQMDFANPSEAIKETLMDVEEEAIS